MTPPKPTVPRRHRTKSAPCEDQSADDVKTQYPQLMAKIKRHMDAFKNGDRSEENKAGMKAAIEELQRAKGGGKGDQNTAVKVESQNTRLYEESYTPNEGPAPATKKRSHKGTDDESSVLVDSEEGNAEKKKAPRNARNTDGDSTSDKREKKPDKERKSAEKADGEKKPDKERKSAEKADGGNSSNKKEKKPNKERKSAGAEIGDEQQKKKRKNQPPEEVEEDETIEKTIKKKKKHSCEGDTTPPVTKTKGKKTTQDDDDTSDKTGKSPPPNDEGNKDDDAAPSSDGNSSKNGGTNGKGKGGKDKGQLALEDLKAAKWTSRVKGHGKGKGHKGDRQEEEQPAPEGQVFPCYSLHVFISVVPVVLHGLGTSTETPRKPALFLGCL